MYTAVIAVMIHGSNGSGATMPAAENAYALQVKSIVAMMAVTTCGFSDPRATASAYESGARKKRYACAPETIMPKCASAAIALTLPPRMKNVARISINKLARGPETQTIHRLAVAAEIPRDWPGNQPWPQSRFGRAEFSCAPGRRYV